MSNLITFSNFIAFGNRITIDLRVVQFGYPRIIHVQRELALPELSYDLAHDFVEAMHDALNELRAKCQPHQGLSLVVDMLNSLEEDIQDGEYTTCDFHEAVSKFTLLNKVNLRVE